MRHVSLGPEIIREQAHITERWRKRQRFSLFIPRQGSAVTSQAARRGFGRPGHQASSLGINRRTQGGASWGGRGTIGDQRIEVREVREVVTSFGEGSLHTGEDLVHLLRGVDVPEDHRTVR